MYSGDEQDTAAWANIKHGNRWLVAVHLDTPQVKPNVGLRRRRVCKLRQGARTRARGGKVYSSGVCVSVDPSFLKFSTEGSQLRPFKE